MRDDRVLHLEHGKPLIFGKARDRGIRLNGFSPEIVSLGSGISADDLLHHDERVPEPSLAFLLAQMRQPAFPEPMGVLRCVEAPTYDQMMFDQIRKTREKLGPGDLDEMFNDADTWDVQ